MDGPSYGGRSLGVTIFGMTKCLPLLEPGRAIYRRGDGLRDSQPDSRNGAHSLTQAGEEDDRELLDCLDGVA